MKRVLLAAFAAFAGLAGLAACGYEPLHGGPARERLGVVVVRSKVPDAAASDEVAAGVRDELARAGALEPGSGYPRCEIEILRADEASEAIAKGSGGWRVSFRHGVGWRRGNHQRLKGIIAKC